MSDDEQPTALSECWWHDAEYTRSGEVLRCLHSGDRMIEHTRVYGADVVAYIERRPGDISLFEAWHGEGGPEAGWNHFVERLRADDSPRPDEGLELRVQATMAAIEKLKVMFGHLLT